MARGDPGRRFHLLAHSEWEQRNLAAKVYLDKDPLHSASVLEEAPLRMSFVPAPRGQHQPGTVSGPQEGVAGAEVPPVAEEAGAVAPVVRLEQQKEPLRLSLQCAPQ